MGKQYAISISDIMNTYSYATAHRQDQNLIELAAGTINVETEEKGSRYIDTVYVENRPAVIIFEECDKE